MLQVCPKWHFRRKSAECLYLEGFLTCGLWAAGSVRGDRAGLGPAEASRGSVSFCRLWPLIPRQSQPTHCNVDSSLQAPQPQFPHLPPMKSKHCSLLTEGGANRETALSREGSSSSEHWSATLGKSRSLPGPGPPHSSLFRCTPLTAATGGTVTAPRFVSFPIVWTSGVSGTLGQQIEAPNSNTGGNRSKG